MKNEELEKETLDNATVPKKILHVENNKIVEQVQEEEGIQDIPKKTKKSDTNTPIIPTKYDNKLVEEANPNRFSSDEETDSGDSDDDSSDAANAFIETDLAKDLKKWFFSIPIPNTHLDALLKTLKRYHSELPACAKTFLKTGTKKYLKLRILKKMIRTMKPNLFTLV